LRVVAFYIQNAKRPQKEKINLFTPSQAS
jgi:hypothetical protein